MSQEYDALKTLLQVRAAFGQCKTADKAGRSRMWYTAEASRVAR